MSKRWELLGAFLDDMEEKLGVATEPQRHVLRTILGKYAELDDCCDYCGRDESQEIRGCQCWNDE